MSTSIVKSMISDGSRHQRAFETAQRVTGVAVFLRTTSSSSSSSSMDCGEGVGYHEFQGLRLVVRGSDVPQLGTLKGLNYGAPRIRTSASAACGSCGVALPDLLYQRDC